MKILESRTAPNPRRVRIFVAEKGLDIPYQQLDFMKELKTEAFKKLNHFQRVPVLVLDDGTAISETVAICRYLEETHPEPALFGVGALGRATVEMWNRRMELGLLMHVAQAFRHTHPAMATLEVPQVKEWGEANKPRALEMLAYMNEELAGRAFIAGEAYSIADVTALVAVDFMKPARIERPSAFQNVERWYGEVSSRPSAKA
ncbi:MAG: glutathione S-transferase [Hyphomicrobiaceae bacterium]|nr:glutathione S-transferase [Hyphomicrobiaceae bacterium]